MIIRPVDTPKTPMVTIKIYLSHCGRTQQPTDTTATVINQHAHYIPVFLFLFFARKQRMVIESAEFGG